MIMCKITILSNFFAFAATYGPSAMAGRRLNNENPDVQVGDLLEFIVDLRERAAHAFSNDILNHIKLNDHIDHFLEVVGTDLSHVGIILSDPHGELKLCEDCQCKTFERDKHWYRIAGRMTESDKLMIKTKNFWNEYHQLCNSLFPAGIPHENTNFLIEMSISWLRQTVDEDMPVEVMTEARSACTQVVEHLTSTSWPITKLLSKWTGASCENIHIPMGDDSRPTCVTLIALLMRNVGVLPAHTNVFECTTSDLATLTIWGGTKQTNASNLCLNSFTTAREYSKRSLEQHRRLSVNEITWGYNIGSPSYFLMCPDESNYGSLQDHYAPHDLNGIPTAEGKAIISECMSRWISTMSLDFASHPHAHHFENCYTPLIGSSNIDDDGYCTNMQSNPKYFPECDSYEQFIRSHELCLRHHKGLITTLPTGFICYGWGDNSCEPVNGVHWMKPPGFALPVRSQRDSVLVNAVDMRHTTTDQVKDIHVMQIASVVMLSVTTTCCLIICAFFAFGQVGYTVVPNTT